MIKDFIDANDSAKPSDKEIDILHRYFPSCFNKEGAFDLDKFRETISNKLEITREGYSLNFLGKSYAKLLTSLDPTTVVVPDEAHNALKENRESGNLFISGDNLEALKHLKGSYAGRIKCIYIDPPYNTGNDGFVYNDKFAFTADELSDRLDIDLERAEKLLSYTTKGSSSHSAWLTFMAPRLQLARDLLSDDGVIFISIDDNEQANLKLLCDAIFGEDCFLGQITRKQSSGSKNDTGHDRVIMSADYILPYCKTPDFSFNPVYVANSKSYSLEDEKGKFSIRALEMQGGGDTLPQRPRMGYSVYYNKEKEDVVLLFDYDLNQTPVYQEPDPDFISKGYKCYRPRRRGDMALGRWRWGDGTFMENFRNGEVYFDDARVYSKERAKNELAKYPNAVLEGYINTLGTKTLKELFKEKVFTFPKPVELIEYLMKVGMDEDSIIMDFFSGSATTAHAVMSLNAKDDGNRRYILVQLPEATGEKSEAFKSGYKTIDEIGMERIRRAARKIKEETGAVIDYGFKHYTLSEVPQNTLDKILDFDVNSLFSDPTLLEAFGRATVLATWMVRDGYGLGAEPREIDLSGYTAYYIGNHFYFLNPGYNADAHQAFIELYGNTPGFGPENVVLYGYSFTMSEKDLFTNNKVTLPNHNLNIRYRY